MKQSNAFRWDEKEQHIKWLRATPEAELHNRLQADIDATLEKISEERQSKGLVLLLLKIKLRKQTNFKAAIALRRHSQMKAYPEVQEVLENYDLKFQHEMFRTLECVHSLKHHG